MEGDGGRVRGGDRPVALEIELQPGLVDDVQRRVVHAVVGVAAQVTLDAAGVCRYAGIGLTNVGPVSLKANLAEARLLGNPLDEDAIGEAARLAAEASDPSTDLRGSEAYKRAMVEELTKRALRRAAERAG